MVRLSEINSLLIASAWLNEEIKGNGYTPDDIVSLCESGDIQLYATLPGWVTNGFGEVDWRNTDPITRELKPVPNAVSDGWIIVTKEMARRIRYHGTSSLDCARMPVVNITLVGMIPSTDTVRGIRDGRMVDISHIWVRRETMEALARKLQNQFYATPPVLPPTAPVANDSGSWHQKAREIADEFDAIDAKAGAHDSIKGISDRVEKRMREQKLFGPRGPLSAGNILRESLSGSKWRRKQ